MVYFVGARCVRCFGRAPSCALTFSLRWDHLPAHIFTGSSGPMAVSLRRASAGAASSDDDWPNWPAPPLDSSGSLQRVGQAPKSDNSDWPNASQLEDESAWRDASKITYEASAAVKKSAPLSIFDRRSAPGPFDGPDSSGGRRLHESVKAEATSLTEEERFPGRGSRRALPSFEWRNFDWNHMRGVNTDKIPGGKMDGKAERMAESAPGNVDPKSSTPHKGARSRRTRPGAVFIPAGGLPTSGK